MQQQTIVDANKKIHYNNHNQDNVGHLLWLRQRAQPVMSGCKSTAQAHYADNTVSSLWEMENVGGYRYCVQIHNGTT